MSRPIDKPFMISKVYEGDLMSLLESEPKQSIDQD